MEIVIDFIFFGSKITAYCDCSCEIKKMLAPWKKIYANLDSVLKKTETYFANKGLSSQCYGFSSSHVWMWELDNKFKKRLSAEELMPLNCGAGEDSWKSLGQQGDQTNQS